MTMNQWKIIINNKSLAKYRLNVIFFKLQKVSLVGKGTMMNE